MDDKNLIEDEIVDLTDLLEEGNPPSGASKDNSPRKRVNEPDSFDLGKEISMEYEVSVEEIEQDTVNLEPGKTTGEEVKQDMPLEEFGAEPSSEPLLDIEKEIDLAIKDKFEDVSLTSKEEEMLLKDEPAEEKAQLDQELPAEAAGMPLQEAPQASPGAVDTGQDLILEEKSAAPKTSEPSLESLLEEKTAASGSMEAELESIQEEKPATAKVMDAEIESLLEEKPVSGPAEIMADDLAPAVEISESELKAIESEPEEPEVAPAVAPVSAAFPPAAAPEAVTGALIEELRKDMPAMIENIMRPLVKEALQEVVAATRDALPSLVEKIIREEIEKLKKI